MASQGPLNRWWFKQQPPGFLTCVGHSGRYQLVQHAVRDWCSVFVVSGHSSQRLLLPHPVLKHLGGHLHKVRLHLGPTEVWKSGLTQTKIQLREPPHTWWIFMCCACSDAHLGADLVHDVAKLVEVSLHLMVLEQRGPAFPRLGKVCHHGCHWKSPLPVWSCAARLKAEAGCMAVLSFPGGEKAQCCKCDKCWSKDESNETVDRQETHFQRLQYF